MINSKNATAGAVRFYLIGNRGLSNPKEDLDKIVAYFRTAGSVTADYDKDGDVTISYEGTSVKSFLVTENKSKKSDIKLSRQLMLVCNKGDNASVNLLRNVVTSIGYRVYNPTLECFLVNELNLMDLTTINVDLLLTKVFENHGLEPLFRYRGSSIYYARNKKDKTVYLVNSHLLVYFLENKDWLHKVENIGVKVAPDLATFIALFDRGLIPTSFYRTHFSDDLTMLNQSGFDLNKLTEPIYFTPIFFKLDKPMQVFKSIKPNMKKDLLKKGSKVTDHIRKTLTQMGLPKKYLVAKVAHDIAFEPDSKGKLIPRLTFSIFMN
jgi:hypothetical protein